MSIIKRGPDTYLVRVYMGTDPITKKRVEVNETVHGTLSCARKRKAQLKAQKYSGRLVRSPHMTVDGLFSLYLDSARHTLGVTTYPKYNVIYRAYARPYIGNILIAKIKRADIQQLFNFLLDPKEQNGDKKDDKRPAGMGLSVGTVHFVKNVLRVTFEFAIENQLIAENPVSRTKLPVRGKPRADSLTTEEAKALVSVRRHFWWDNALIFQLYTGLRTQELTALIWDDVDFDKGLLRIERACKRVGCKCVEIGSPKTEKSYRVIKLAPVLLTLLRCHHEAQQKVIESHRKPKPYGGNMVNDWIRRARPGKAHLYTRTDLIFPNPNGRVPCSTVIHVAFKKMLRRAGIPAERRVRQYDLRHTHASFLLAVGVPTVDTAARLGHSMTACERTYGHPLEERRDIPSQAFTDLIPLELSPHLSPPERESTVEPNQLPAVSWRDDSGPQLNQ